MSARMNDMVDIDEKNYTKAKPHFQKIWKQAKDAGFWQRLTVRPESSHAGKGSYLSDQS